MYLPSPEGAGIAANTVPPLGERSYKYGRELHLRRAQLQITLISPVTTPTLTTNQGNSLT